MAFNFALRHYFVGPIRVLLKHLALKPESSVVNDQSLGYLSAAKAQGRVKSVTINFILKNIFHCY